MQTIKTFTDACLKIGKDPMATYHPFEKLEIIIAAIVGDWKADYSDEEQPKYYPYFIYDASSSCFRFHLSVCAYTSAIAGSGVRLSLETREQSDYVGKTFIDEYNALLQRK
jgi:hypothetical protein